MATHGSDAKMFIGPSVADNPAAPTTPDDWDEFELSRDATLNQQKAEVETTTRASGMDDEYIPGHRNSTLDVEGLFPSEADPAFQAVVANFFADKELVWWKLQPLGTGTGLPEHVFRGFVSNAPVAMPLKDVVSAQFTVRVSGAQARDTQS